MPVIKTIVCYLTSGQVRNKNQKASILFNSGFISELALEQEIERLNDILLTTESSEQFCNIHELVDRNRITSQKEKIVKECSRIQLKPFRFLINKN
jgi:hypothetical protein